MFSTRRIHSLHGSVLITLVGESFMNEVSSIDCILPKFTTKMSLVEYCFSRGNMDTIKSFYSTILREIIRNGELMFDPIFLTESLKLTVLKFISIVERMTFIVIFLELYISLYQIMNLLSTSLLLSVKITQQNLESSSR